DIEVKVRPVGEMRSQDAVEDAHGPSHRDVFVRSVESQQPEVDAPEPQPQGEDKQFENRAGGAGGAGWVSCRRDPAGWGRRGRLARAWARASWLRASLPRRWRRWSHHRR